MSASSVGESGVCLACRLLRCLQTASAPAAETVPVPVALDALPPGADRLAERPACVTASARAPPAT